MTMPDEPEIIINGVRLGEGQAMTVRVALASFDPDCGNDEHGREMTRLYTLRRNEVFKLMAAKSTKGECK